MSLNPEPSVPEERAEHHLPPKTYADAAEEALHSGPQSHANGTTDEVKTNGIHPTSDEEKTSHEGVGQDGSPKSPTARGHRRVPSRSSRRSSNNTQDNQPPKDMFENHTNGNGDALTSVKPSQDIELPKKDRRIDRKRRDSELTTGRQAGAGWSKSKIRFAPMNVPLQRRLQTLAVLMHTLSIVGSLAIFFFLCSIPLLWPILLPYTVYVLFSNAGTSGELSLRSEWFRRLPVWSLFASYFPARLHRSQELEPTRKYYPSRNRCPIKMISNNAVLLSALACCAAGTLAMPTTPPGLSKRAQDSTDLWKVPPRRTPSDPKGDAWQQINLVEATIDKAADDGRLYSYYPALYNVGGSIYVMFSGSPKDVDGMGQDVRISFPTNNGWSKPEIAFPPALLPNQTTVETSEYYCKRGITQRALQPLGIFYTGGDESSPRYYAVAQSSDNICPGSFQSAGRVARRLNIGNAGGETFAGEPCWVDTNEYTGAHQWAETVYGTKYNMKVCEDKDKIIAALNQPENIPAQSASLSGKPIVAADGKHNVTYPTNAVYLNDYLGSSSPAPYMRFWADDSTINRTGDAFVEYFDDGKKSFFPLKNDGSNIEQSNIYSSWKAWFGSSNSADQTRVYISNSGMNSDLSSEILTVAVSRGKDLAFRSIGILRTDASKSVPKGTRGPTNTDGPGFWWPSASFAGDKLLVAYSENKASIQVATVNFKDLP